MLTVNVLQDRITELVDKLGRQGPELAAAQQELTRLRGVEMDLSRTAMKLQAEITALNANHKAELETVVSAGDALRAERDAATAALEAMRSERDDITAQSVVMTLR